MDTGRLLKMGAKHQADGQCEYIYRMQNTVDHTNVSELASIIGVRCEQST
jgi:hypothetical protein